MLVIISSDGCRTCFSVYKKMAEKRTENSWYWSFIISRLCNIRCVFFHTIEPDQVTYNNEIFSSSSTSLIYVATQNESVKQVLPENTDKQSIHVQDKKSDENDGLGFWGWFRLIFFAFIALSIFVHWQDKRKKRFKEKVSEQVLMPPPHIHPSSDLSVVNKMSPELEKKTVRKEGTDLSPLCSVEWRHCGNSNYYTMVISTHSYCFNFCYYCLS
ncbi:hypothetical protein [Bartonella grahamii]|uniref:hypothetical protein n=1 Tax=Bartonella grahamii TaxID=33045 RepID=UPI001FEE31DA|nr:hypothetical protein [Bartonella grahamii]